MTYNYGFDNISCCQDMSRLNVYKIYVNTCQDVYQNWNGYEKFFIIFYWYFLISFNICIVINVKCYL